MPRVRCSRFLTLAAAAAVVLPGCSIGGPSPSPSPAGGGAVTIGVWQVAPSLLDGGITGSDEFADLTDAPVQEGLLWYRPAPETAHATGPASYWAPDLAVEVPTVANGDVRTSGCATAHAAMCVTWKLRQGVRWDDGSTLSSRDVCETFDFRWLTYGAAGKTSPTGLASTAGWDQVLACHEVDAATAVVDFASQYGPYLSVGSGVYGILPASILDRALAAGGDLQKLSLDLDLRRGSGNAQAFHGTGTMGALLDGTGPFVLQSYVPGRSLTLVRNDDYWNRAAAPHLDRLVFVDEGDLATEVANVTSGAVDVGFDLRLQSLDAVLAAAKGANAVLRVDTVPEGGAEKIDLNLCAGDGGLCDNAAADQSMYTADATVRRALLTAIDRGAIANTVAHGRTVVPRDSWLYLGASYLDAANVSATRFDRAAANAMLDAAGDTRSARCGTAPDGQSYRQWKDGSCLVLDLGTTADDPVRVKVEGMVQHDLGLVGIAVPDLKPNQPAARFFAPFVDGGPLYTHAYDMAMFALAISIPGEPASLAATYHADCMGACPQLNEIASSGNGGQGVNDTGVDDPMLDAALDAAGTTVDTATRIARYDAAEQRLAVDLPEIPLYQQIEVNTYSTRLHGTSENDLVPDFDTEDWYV